jgi:1,4-alpha-glucan branching enzyme
MPTIPVQFVYLTGLKRPIFRNLRLRGSWGITGHYSDHWSTFPMEAFTADDGCPAFRVRAEFDAAQLGWRFQWGVILDGPSGSNVWGIPAEISLLTSTDRHREFTLHAAARNGEMQEERYYLTHCRRLGAQKVFARDESNPGIRFSVWAPNATNVQVIMGALWDGDDVTRRPTDASLPFDSIAGGYITDDGTGKHPHRGPFPMTPRGNGIWEADVPPPIVFADFDHKPYTFQVTKRAGGNAVRTDLHSRCQIGKGQNRPGNTPYVGKIMDLDGRVGCSVVVDPEQVTRNFREPVWPEKHFIAQEQFWKDEFREGRPVPNRVEDLVIYELHVGALGYGKKTPAGNPQPGDFQDAMNLLPYLADLGVNAVELLPMAEFGQGEGAWGYGNSHHFAIEFAAGGRDQFKFFVRECHRRGIAVILDVVYNHYTPDAERAEWTFDSDAPDENIYYWYEGRPSDYAHPDGGYLDNFSSGWAPRYHDEMVRQLFISSAATLVEEFHVDGFRVDLTDAIHALNTRHSDGRPVDNANLFGAKFLREWCRTLKLIHPTTMLIAEDHTEWDQMIARPDDGGIGFDAVWYVNFYHHLVGNPNQGTDKAKLLLTAGFGDDRALAMDYFAGALSWTGHQKVVYDESHDEAGNAAGSRRTISTAVNGAPLFGETRRYAEARCRFAFGMAALSTGTPMFLMGEEVGAQKPYRYDDFLEYREDLFGQRKGDGSRMFQFYQDMIRLRRNHPGLRSRQIDVLHVHDANRVIAFRRWDRSDDFLVLASLNNHPFRSGYVIENSRLPDGLWKEVLNSDGEAYGGDDVGNLGGSPASTRGWFNAVIPANGVAVFQRET